MGPDARARSGQGYARVTRELKLALILGFAVVLVVAVLLADHLSAARTAQLSDATGASPTEVDGAGLNSPTIPGSITRAGPLASKHAEPAPPTLAAHEPAGAVVIREPGAGALASAEPVPPTIVQGAPDVIASGVRAGGSTDERAGGASNQPGASTGPFAQLADTLPAGWKIEGGKLVPPGQPGPKPAYNTVDVDAKSGKPLEKLASAFSEPSDAAPVHVVEAGDSLYKLAKRYYNDGEAWRKLADANAATLDKGIDLQVGMKLKIPAPESLGLKPRPAKNAAPAKPGPSVIALEKGKDKAESPAGKRAPEALAKGGKLPAKAAKGEAKAATYTVRAGDTLGVIAMRTLGSSRRTEDLLAVNSDTIDDPDSLEVGTVLRVPSR